MGQRLRWRRKRRGKLLSFRLTAEEVAAVGLVQPAWHYEHEPETREALDLIFSEHFSQNEPGVFAIRDSLLNAGDLYMHLADLTSYLEADERLARSTTNRTRGRKRRF